VLTKSGAWYLYGDRKLGQGRDNAKLYLEQNPDFAEELKEKILAARGLAETQTE
jgi:recombination protein RecA